MSKHHKAETDVIDTENQQVAARGEGKKQVRETKWCKLAK